MKKWLFLILMLSSLDRCKFTIYCPASPQILPFSRICRPPSTPIKSKGKGVDRQTHINCKHDDDTHEEDVDFPDMPCVLYYTTHGLNC